ncbi:MAG: alpha/beta hydrolase [Candidatus Kapaibacteriales bacterium]
MQEKQWTAKTLGGCTIEGTYIAPKQGMPTILIISGSGPTDRNGNNPQMTNNSLKMLAHSLAAEGIGSLRYDKRQIGKSLKGCQMLESEMRIDTLVDDAALLIEGLRRSGTEKIIVLGHSQGALVGLLAAQKAYIDGFISLAGQGYRADKVIAQQLRQQIQNPTLLEKAISSLDTLASGDTLISPNPMLYQLFRPSVQPFMISWFKYDPAELISDLIVPSLVIGGSEDLQVDTEQTKSLASAIDKEAIIITDMNHVLKKVIESDMNDNISAYSDPERQLAPGLVHTITKFAQSR